MQLSAMMTGTLDLPSDQLHMVLLWGHTHPNNPSDDQEIVTFHKRRLNILGLGAPNLPNPLGCPGVPQIDPKSTFSGLV